MSGLKKEDYIEILIYEQKTFKIMLLYITIIVVMILCIIGTIKLSENHGDLSAVCAILSTLTCLAVIVMTVYWCCELSNSKESHMAEYNNLKDQLEQSNYAPELHEKVLEMNNKIDYNKIHHENVWIGMWYDEKLGKCEKIEWKSCQ